MRKWLLFKTIRCTVSVYIETTDIHEWFLKNAERYDNIRILKSKMENAIFEKLTDHFIIMTGSMAEGTQDRV